MESCLLCLELNGEFVQRIQINSVEWQEFDVHNVIEKHLWPLEILQTSLHSWLCKVCWQELYNFHKFYKRVEKSKLKLSYTSEEVGTLLVNNDVKNEDLKPNIESVICEDKNYESEVKSFCNDVIFEGVNTVIKEEIQITVTPLVEETVPIKRKKRLCQSKNMINFPVDPLLEKKSKKDKVFKKILNEKRKFKTSNETTSNEKNKTTLGKEKLGIVTEAKNVAESLQNNECEQNYNCSDSDSNYNSEPNTQKADEKTSKHNESDNFLAVHFKITCSLCQIQAETFHDLCQHFKSVHKRNGYVVCCNKKFYRRSYLVEHIHQHANPNYFKCTICDKVLADRKCLNKHKKRHFGKREKQHQCDICDKSFTMYLSLRLHKASHVPEEEKHFTCAECDKNFASKFLLSNHFRAVHLKNNIRICDICGKAIKCKEVFERHMLQHEGKPYTITCDICSLKLTSKNGLKRHKLNMHPEGEKQEFSCPVCSKLSPNLKALNKHIRYNHKWGYDHKCTICEKAFKTAQTLMEHMASHTGTVLYTCPWCPKTFNSNANFYSHRKKAHPKEWEEANRKKYSDNALSNNKNNNNAFATS